MCDFIKKLLFSIFFLIVILVASFKVNNGSYLSYNYSPNDSTKTIITGSSLVTNGIAPKLIPNSENIGLAAEPLILSYYKIDDLFFSKANIDNVIVSYSLIDVANHWDNAFCNGRKNSGELMKRLLGLRKIINYREISNGFKFNSLLYMEQYIRYRIFPNFIRWCDCYFYNNHMSYMQIGGYNPSPRHLVVSENKLKEVIDNMFPIVDDQHRAISQSMCHYLDSIVSICQHHKVHLYVIGMPMSKALYDKVDTIYKNSYKADMERLNSMDYVQAFDCTNMITEDKWFKDYVHLNKEGSVKFTTMVNAQLITP